MTIAAPRRPSPRTARTKLADALAQNLAKDFTEYGADAIAKMRADKPLDYLKLVLSLLPKGLVEEESGTHGYQVVERRIIRPEDPDG